MLKMSDIASYVGVSATTVSLVLNEGPEGSSRVSDKTRQKILQAAEEMGYRSNRLARAMRTGNTKMLGILGGRAGEEHVGRMLEGALEAADTYGYTLKLLRLHAIGSSPEQALRSISELRLMGIIALHLPGPLLPPLHAEATKTGIPLVLMDSRYAGSGIPQIISDDIGGIKEAIDHLVQLGHTRIGMINGGKQDSISRKRQEGFEEALRRNNLLGSGCVVGSYHHQIPSLEAARSFLEQPVSQRPTAIFCASDFIAMATLKVANNLGIQVPSELSVIGFDNFKFTEYLNPALTTIEQPFQKVGATSVETLLHLIEHGNHNAVPQSTPLNAKSNIATSDKILLPTRLIVRDSTAPP